jgi:two-component system, chemotaxis family, sensor histidine kinase and response regulator PixL
MNDSQIQIQAYSYFLTEAPELLQAIEHEILTLPNEHTTTKVHNLMRALHTLKGAAANVGLATIELIAHEFEDVARVFYDLEIEIDVSIQSLLLDGYSGLDECLNAQIMDRQIDESAILDRIAATIAQLKVKLGDWSEADIPLPTAMELGFDIVESIFETTIQEQLDQVVAVIATKDPAQITTCLELVTETCISLAQSFELPGFVLVNQAIIAAISQHPDRLVEIARIALANLQQAQADVLAGDRTLGGEVSAELAQLAQVSELELLPELEFEAFSTQVDFGEADQTLAIELPIIQPIAQPELIAKINYINDVIAGEAELPRFQAFLISDTFSKRHEFSIENQHLFRQIVRLCWDWFRHEIQPPAAQLNLELLVLSEGLADLDYIYHWVGLLLQGLNSPTDRVNLQLYRECCVYQVVFAVAKYVAGTAPHPHPQLTPDFLAELRSHLQAITTTYQQEPPVTANERGWIDRIIIPHHWSAVSESEIGEDLLLSEIWGQPDFGISQI